MQVTKSYWSSNGGSYELRVDAVRGSTQLESDANYSNDTISGANVLTLTHGAPGHSVATVAGTIMAPEGSRGRRLYLLGTLSAGNVVTLNVQLPSTSTWNGMVTVVDASGTPVADTDGTADGHFQGTIPANGAYYAEVLPVWNYNGHTYVVTDSSMTWANAEAYAQELGGHLATINDAAEQTVDSDDVQRYVWRPVDRVDGPGDGGDVPLVERPVGDVHELGVRAAEQRRQYNCAPANYTVFQTDGTGTTRAEGTLPGSSGVERYGDRRFGGWSGGAIPAGRGRAGPDAAEGGLGQSAAGSWRQHSSVVDRLVVTTSKDLDPATVNVNNQMVWKYNGHFYVVTDSSMTWADAEAYAQSLGGHLVTVNDAAEQTWLYQTFGRFGNVWIGMTDQATEGYVGMVERPVGQLHELGVGGALPWHQLRTLGAAYLDGNGQLGRSNTPLYLPGVIELDGPDSDGDGVPDVLDAYPADPLNNFDLRGAGAGWSLRHGRRRDLPADARSDVHDGDEHWPVHPARPVAQRALSLHGQRHAERSRGQSFGRQRGRVGRRRLPVRVQRGDPHGDDHRIRQRRHARDGHVVAVDGGPGGEQVISWGGGWVDLSGILPSRSSQ